MYPLHWKEFYNCKLRLGLDGADVQRATKETYKGAEPAHSTQDKSQWFFRLTD